MGIFDSLFDNIAGRVADRINDWMLPQAYAERRKELAGQRMYRVGIQKKQLHNKPTSPDDNIIMNFTGLVIDRSVSMLFGKGIEFDYQNDATEQYLNQVWDANRKELLLHKIGTTGGESGTWYCKVIPDGKGNGIPRLVVLDPLLMTIETKEDDIEQVTAYVITYMVKRDGKEKAFMEKTSLQDNGQWLIESGIFENSKFKVETKQVWDWEFPPIIHGQNLPSVESVYGVPDATEDVRLLQDRINLTSSNISKILRLHAHPILKGMGFGNGSPVDIEPGKIVPLSQGQDILSVEMQSDLSSSNSYFMTLRQSMFDITRTVDISSMNDKLGALTNFGLRVLYQDALAKNATKQQLYGDAILELNRRMLLLAGMQEDEGNIEWPDPLPVNETEEIAGLKFDLENGLASKETASDNRGYNYENEQPKIEQEKSQGDNIGAALLANFTRG